MNITARLQDVRSMFECRLHLPDEAMNSVHQRILHEIEQIRMPTGLLKRTIAHMAGAGSSGRHLMSGEALSPGADPDFPSDGWIGHLAQTRENILIETLRESLQRLVLHQDELSVWLNVPVRNIRHIGISDSETHNNGRFLIIYTLDDGSRVVYKPVCLRSVKLFDEIVHDILGDDSELVTAPRCYPAGEDYGFLEYLEKGTGGSGDKDPQRFYYRSGVLLSLAYALRITDLHDGNLIASGEFPVLFDLETSFYQFPGDLDFTDVRDTGMIGNEGSSGIEGGGSSWEWDPRLEHGVHGGQVLRYTRRVWFDDNRIYQGEVLAEPGRYADDIIAGFRYGYEAVMNNRAKIISRLDRACEEGGMRLRHLVRHTAYYNLLLAWLRQPVTAPGAGREEELPDDLYRNYKGDHPLSREVHAAERDDLLRGDIPYFWTSFGGYDLEHLSGTVRKNYFARTSYQAAVEHLERMSPADMNHQAGIIRECMRMPNA